MSENIVQTQEAPLPSLSMQRCYLKDLSLEMPNAPTVFLDNGQVDLDLNITVGSAQLQDSVYEVVLCATLTAKLPNKLVYLLEIQQAGIFELNNMPADDLAHVLQVTCPTIIYPYLRANAAETITRTGLAPFHLPEINWEALFQHARQELALAQREVTPMLH